MSSPHQPDDAIGPHRLAGQEHPPSSNTPPQQALPAAAATAAGLRPSALRPAAVRPQRLRPAAAATTRTPTPNSLRPERDPYGQQRLPRRGPYDQNPYGAYPQPGYAQPYPGYGQPYPAPRGTNTMAILALVFGILVAPLGLVFGFVARSQIKKTGEDGDGLALAGIIIGGIFTLLFIAYIVFIIIFFAAVASSVPLR